MYNLRNPSKSFNTPSSALRGGFQVLHETIVVVWLGKFSPLPMLDQDEALLHLFFPMGFFPAKQKGRSRQTNRFLLVGFANKSLFPNRVCLGEK